MTYKTNKTTLVLGITAAIILSGIVMTSSTFNAAVAQTPQSTMQSTQITKFLKVTGQKQGSITGSVTEKGKEGTIAVLAIDHSIISPRDPASGLPTGKRMHSPLVIVTHIDKATPLLYNALVNNENLPTVELDFYKPKANGKDALYFTIKLTNANISSVKQTNLNSDDDPQLGLFGEYEEVAFTYQKIEWTWIDGGITAQDDWEAPVA